MSSREPVDDKDALEMQEFWKTAGEPLRKKVEELRKKAETEALELEEKVKAEISRLQLMKAQLLKEPDNEANEATLIETERLLEAQKLTLDDRKKALTERIEAYKKIENAKNKAELEREIGTVATSIRGNKELSRLIINSRGASARLEDLLHETAPNQDRVTTQGKIYKEAYEEYRKKLEGINEEIDLINGLKKSLSPTAKPIDKKPLAASDFDFSNALPKQIVKPPLTFIAPSTPSVSAAKHLVPYKRIENLLLNYDIKTPIAKRAKERAPLVELLKEARGLMLKTEKRSEQLQILLGVYKTCRKELYWTVRSNLDGLLEEGMKGLLTEIRDWKIKEKQEEAKKKHTTYDNIETTRINMKNDDEIEKAAIKFYHESRPKLPPPPIPRSPSQTL